MIEAAGSWPPHPWRGKAIRDVDFPGRGAGRGGQLKGDDRPEAQLVRMRLDEGRCDCTIFAMAEDVPEVERLLQVSDRLLLNVAPAVRLLLEIKGPRHTERLPLLLVILMGIGSTWQCWVPARIWAGSQDEFFESAQCSFTRAILFGSWSDVLPGACPWATAIDRAPTDAPAPPDGAAWRLLCAFAGIMLAVPVSPGPAATPAF